MILEDIQLTGHSRIILPDLPLIHSCRLNACALKELKAMIMAVDGQEWLNTSTITVKASMDSDIKKMIREAETETTKAKNLAKEKFPKEVTNEMRRLILNNPFKAFIGWLLTLK